MMLPRQPHLSHRSSHSAQATAKSETARRPALPRAPQHPRCQYDYHPSLGERACHFAEEHVPAQRLRCPLAHCRRAQAAAAEDHVSHRAAWRRFDTLNRRAERHGDQLSLGPTHT
eukprot:scaffold164044_cov31-Tisochrysis_lutea.AAC.2